MSAGDKHQLPINLQGKTEKIMDGWLLVSSTRGQECLKKKLLHEIWK